MRVSKAVRLRLAPLLSTRMSRMPCQGASCTGIRTLASVHDGAHKGGAGAAPAGGGNGLEQQVHCSAVQVIDQGNWGGKGRTGRAVDERPAGLVAQVSVCRWGCLKHYMPRRAQTTMAGRSRGLQAVQMVGAVGSQPCASSVSLHRCMAQRQFRARHVPCCNDVQLAVVAA